ncbi:MAG: arginine N-succinyltransferase [Actinomycetota bacterium]
MLRPATADDGEALWALLASTIDELTGMASLPTSAEAAEDRCRTSAATVAALDAGPLTEPPPDAEGRSLPLLFVLAQPGAGPLLGVTGATVHHGVVNHSVEIATNRHGKGLSLRGRRRRWTCTELNATFLDARARGAGLGTLLSRGRLAFLASVADRIPATIVSHLRGPATEGAAPFWHSFGVRVLPEWPTSSVAEARLVSEPDRLDELSAYAMPIDPSVLEVLGSVHEASLPAFRLLHDEGLRPNGMYDPVDGGPTLTGELAGLLTTRRRRPATVIVGDGHRARSDSPDGPGEEPTRLSATGVPASTGKPVDALVTNARINGFGVQRAAIGLSGSPDHGVAELPPELAAALGLDTGAACEVIPLRAGTQAESGGAVR